MIPAKVPLPAMPVTRVPRQRQDHLPASFREETGQVTHSIETQSSRRTWYSSQTTGGQEMKRTKKTVRKGSQEGHVMKQSHFSSTPDVVKDADEKPSFMKRINVPINVIVKKNVTFNENPILVEQSVKTGAKEVDTKFGIKSSPSVSFVEDASNKKPREECYCSVAILTMQKENEILNFLPLQWNFDISKNDCMQSDFGEESLSDTNIEKPKHQIDSDVLNAHDADEKGSIEIPEHQIESNVSNAHNAYAKGNIEIPKDQIESDVSKAQNIEMANQQTISDVSKVQNADKKVNIEIPKHQIESNVSKTHNAHKKGSIEIPKGQIVSDVSKAQIAHENRNIEISKHQIESDLSNADEKGNIEMANHQNESDVSIAHNAQQKEGSRNGYFDHLMFLNGWSMPKIINEASELQFNAKDNLLIRLVNTDTKLELFLDVFAYKPHEVMVSARHDMIRVEGRQEEEKSDNPKVLRQFERKYSLPAGSRSDEVMADMSIDGVLCISVPKRRYGGHESCPNCCCCN